jgi:putative membrane protein
VEPGYIGATNFPSGLLASVVRSPHVSILQLLTRWQTDPLSLLILAGAICLAGTYLIGVRRLAAKNRKWSPWRTASFLGGALTVVISVNSGLSYYSNSVFYLHSVQHVLLMNGAPVLFALAAPMTLWLQASDRSLQSFLLRILHNKVFEALTFPALVAAISYGLMLTYFLSGLYTFSEEHPIVLGLLNVLFLVSGCLYWWPVVGLDPSRWKLSFPAKLGYLATGIPVTTFLGLGLVSARYSIDPAIHTLADTQAGGGALWVLSELFTLGAMGAVLVQLMHSEQRAAARYDRRLLHEEANLEREAELERERAARGTASL